MFDNFTTPPRTGDYFLPLHQKLKNIVLSPFFLLLFLFTTNYWLDTFCALFFRSPLTKVNPSLALYFDSKWNLNLGGDNH